jgi:biotin synthase
MVFFCVPSVSLWLKKMGTPRADVTNFDPKRASLVAEGTGSVRYSQYSKPADQSLRELPVQRPSAPAILSSERYQDWADRALNGETFSREECLSILQTPDEDVVELLAATYRVRRRYFGKEVQLYYLKNAKSGLCPEDCGYCSQAKTADTAIDRYVMLNEAQLMAAAKQAADSQARTYCIVASGRGPTNREVEHVAGVVKKVKAEYGLHICCCLGLLTPEQAITLKDAGVDRINHNLNTSRRFYPEICTTHTYEDRLETLRTVSEAGMELCSGLIVGMGERDEDIADVALELQSLGVKSIPVNFLISIEGTPLETRNELDPRYCLKVLCLLRLTNPSTEIRIAGGREVQLRSMQAMGLYAANSMFVSDYLTTKGQPAEADFQMVKDLGFEIVLNGQVEAEENLS